MFVCTLLPIGLALSDSYWYDEKMIMTYMDQKGSQRMLLYLPV